jgi:hypothetical protein
VPLYALQEICEAEFLDDYQRHLVNSPNINPGNQTMRWTYSKKWHRVNLLRKSTSDSKIIVKVCTHGEYKAIDICSKHVFDTIQYSNEQTYGRREALSHSESDVNSNRTGCMHTSSNNVTWSKPLLLPGSIVFVDLCVLRYLNDVDNGRIMCNGYCLFIDLCIYSISMLSVNCAP